jgi:hypothetical protein
MAYPDLNNFNEWFNNTQQKLLNAQAKGFNTSRVIPGGLTALGDKMNALMAESQLDPRSQLITQATRTQGGKAAQDLYRMLDEQEKLKKSLQNTKQQIQAVAPLGNINNQAQQWMGMLQNSGPSIRPQAQQSMPQQNAMNPNLQAFNQYVQQNRIARPRNMDEFQNIYGRFQNRNQQMPQQMNTGGYGQMFGPQMGYNMGQQIMGYGQPQQQMPQQPLFQMPQNFF